MSFDKFSKPFWWSPIVIVVIKYLIAYKGGLTSEIFFHFGHIFKKNNKITKGQFISECPFAHLQKSQSNGGNKGHCQF